VRTGSLTAQNYDSGVLRGRLSVLGSIVQNIRGAVGTNLNGVLNSGYFKSFAYDARLYNPAPPCRMSSIRNRRIPFNSYPSPVSSPL